MHRSEPSRLQSLALQLADKINNFVDSNERILETKQGNFFSRGMNQVRAVLRQGLRFYIFFFRGISEGIDRIIEVLIKIGIVNAEITGKSIKCFNFFFLFIV